MTRIVLEGTERNPDGTLIWQFVVSTGDAYSVAPAVRRWRVTTATERPADILDVHRAHAESIGERTTRDPALDGALRERINEELARVELANLLAPKAQGRRPVRA